MNRILIWTLVERPGEAGFPVNVEIGPCVRASSQHHVNGCETLRNRLRY